MESTSKGNRRLALVKVLIPKLEKDLADAKLQVAESSKLQKSETFANSREEPVNHDNMEIVNHWDQDKGHEGGDLLFQLLGGGQPQIQNMQMDAYYSNDDSIDIKVEVLPSLDYLMPEMDLTEYDANPNEAMIISKPTKPAKPPKPKIHFCPVCKSVGVDRAYSKPSLLRAHLLYHKKTGRAILTPGHARIVEAEGTTYKCAKCPNRTFPNRKAFNQHKTHHRFLIRKYGTDREIGSRDRTEIIPIQDIYNCSFCHKQFEDRKKFLIHLKAHRRIERREKLEGQGDQQGQVRKRSRWSLIPHPDEVQEYKCDICGKIYPPKSRAAYRYHLNRHKEKQAEEEKKKRKMENMRPDIPVADSYHCDMCDRNWTADKRISYLNHVKIHEKLERKGMNRPIAEKKEKGSDDEEEEEQDYYCKMCDKHFNDKSRFRGHNYYHKKLQAKGQDRPIGDQFGNNSTASWKDEIPLDLEIYSCTTCTSRTFEDRDAYISHLGIHRSLKRKGCDRAILTREEWSSRSQKEKSCSECNETFESARAYQEHCREVHPKQKREVWTNWNELVPDQDTYSCSTCVTRTFDSRQAFITHLKIHKSMSRRGEDRPIMSKEQWAQHMRELKAEAKSKPPRTVQNFTCTTCNKGFWKRLAYKNHMRYHQILKRKGRDRVIRERTKSWKEDIPHQASYKCEKCPEREFTERNSFIGHLNYHKMLERKGKGSAPIGHSRHRKGEFTGELKCTICDRIFKDKKIYKGHMNYHYQIRKKTGEDRPIGKKSEIQYLGHVGASGEPVADLMSLMMNDLDGKFVCGCGEKFYFGDALEHHLNLKKSQYCRKLEKVKQEPKYEVEDLDLVNDENIENDKEDNKEILVHGVTNTNHPSSRLTEGNQEQEVEDKMKASMIDPTPEILILQNGVQSQSGNEDEEMIDEPQVDYEFEDVYVENDPFPFNPQVNQNDDDDEGPKLKIEAVETKITPVIVTVNPQQQLKTASQSVALENEEEDDTLAAFYQCQICDAENPSLTEYLRHQYQQHLIDQSSPLPCPFCALQFTLGSELLVHCKEEHSEISSFREFNAACPSCDDFISIVEGPEFEQHFKSSHPKLVCRMCSKMVSAAPALNKHIVSEHLKKKPITPIITSVKGNQ